ncbi:MAG: hypothetical protein E7333_03580 [Clostridiales bacterium]|nr:hypothetical protein [Clostridiales bacterium]
MKMHRKTHPLLRLLACALVLCLALGQGFALAGEEEAVDYASQLKLQLLSNTAKTEATVKTFVDGDTVHFHVPETVAENGVLKGRFLALDTPESTGRIEEYGKAASRFTKEKLSAATSIMLESDNALWNPDSTGDRYLVWVWYKTADMTEYRNLNLEILQNGLAVASSTQQNRYGDTCMAALTQARKLKLNVFSGQPDPDFYYGSAVELTLKELRTNPEKYNGIKVAFNGVITTNYNNTAYIEAYDAETGMYNGLSIYYGFGLNGSGLKILTIGNECRIVGTMQYYETGGTWQVSGLSYRAMRPTDPDNIQKLSEGHSPAYALTSAETFATGKVSVTMEDTVQEFDWAELALGTSIAMNGLTVKDAYITDNEDSSSYGAFTLVCEADGHTVAVRTIPLRDAEGNLLTPDAYMGKTIDVKGIVDYFDGNYQIKVFTADSISVH